MTRAWGLVKVGKYCSKIGSGSTPRGGETVYQAQGVALIRSQNVYNGEFTTDGLAFLGDEQASQLDGVTVKSNDILLNITGDSVARCCQVPDPILPARVNQHVAIVRPMPDEFDSRFLKYFFISPFMQATMLSLAGSGGTRKALTKEMIEGFDVPKPPLPIQQAVGATLSTYDEAMENNRRRMGLLEKAARLLYEEWFVRLRYPGHEHTPLINDLPHGWERKPLERVAEFRLGKMLDQQKNRGDLMPYLANVNVRWGNFDFDDLREMRFKDDELETFGLKFGDILMCEGGEPGRCALWKEQQPRMMIQKAIHRIRPCAGMPHEYLYYSLRHMGQSGHLATLFTGATIKHLPREKLAKVTIVAPTRQLLDQFTSVVRPIENQLKLLEAANANARAARDLLLPRLMSREIKV